MTRKTNANTEHSRELRRKTANEFNKQLTAANKFEIRSKDAAAIALIKAGLAEMQEGKTNAEKLLILLYFYRKNK